MAGSRAIGRVSNEVEFGFEGEMRRENRLNESIYSVEEVGENMVELNISKAANGEELNEWLERGVGWLSMKAEKSNATLYGGGVVESIASAPPKAYLTTTLFPGIGEQLKAILSFQIVIGIRRGFEDGGMRIYNSLLGMLEVLAVLSAASERVWVALPTREGFRFEERVSSIGMARLEFAYPQMEDYLRGVIGDVLSGGNNYFNSLGVATSASAFGATMMLFSPPQAERLESYELVRFMAGEYIKGLVELALSNGRRWWDRRFEEQGFLEKLMENGLAPHQLYYPIRIRSDHSDEEHAFSIEVRIMDNPDRDIWESLEVMKALNEFVLAIAEKAEKGELEELRGRRISFPMSREEVEEALALSRTLLRKARVSERSKNILEGRLRRMGGVVREKVGVG